MNSCNDYQELISRMLDGELDESERAALAAHVRRCPDCAAVYVAFRSLSESLADDLEEPPAQLHRRIMTGVRQSRVRGFSLRRMPAHKRWGTLLAAAACLVLVAGIGLSLPRLTRMGSAAPAASGAGVQSAAAATEERKKAETPQQANAPVPEADAATGAADAPEAPAEAAIDESADRFTLNAEQSAALRERLSFDPAWVLSEPDRELTLVYAAEDGSEQTLTVLLIGEEALYVAADGDKFYRIEGGASALLSLCENG